MTYQKENLVDLTRRIYRLTLLFPKKEPLRYKIREIADEILEKLIFSHHGNPGKIPSKEIVKDLEILGSFLEIAKEQNWVSPKEISEIQNEYQKLKIEVEKETEASFTEVRPPADSRQNSDLGQDRIQLNDRQKKILEILREKEKIQVWQIKEIFPQVSKRTLRRDFQSLYKKGIIERIGQRTNTFYKLKENG
jgi:DNA-binding transcriptional ArsR family regulator